ncbi:Ankyrin repeat domain-containing protein 26-like protein [Aix galericulata]|nr:Ankyrin repeat domain-containing protein 26-like protein [Aix galericulata]
MKKIQRLLRRLRSNTRNEVRAPHTDLQHPMAACGDSALVQPQAKKHGIAQQDEDNRHLPEQLGARSGRAGLACNPWAAESRKMREKLLHAVRKGRKHPALAMGQELLQPDNVHPLWREQDTERTVEPKSDLLAFSPSLGIHQTSRSAAEQMFQREREQWLCLQEKLYRDTSEMQESNKSLSQQLSKAERKAKRLEKEVKQLKELLQEKTLFLQSAERTIEEVRKQAKKCHDLCPQKAQLKKEAAEKEVLQEHLSQLQKTNLSLCQQLEGMRNKAIQETGRDLSAELEVEHELMLQLVDDKQKLQKQMPAVSQARSEQISIQEMAFRKYQEQQMTALKSEVGRTQSLQQETLLQLARVEAKIDRSDQQYLMDIRRRLTDKLNRANDLLADLSAERPQEHLPSSSSVARPTLRSTLKTGKDLLGTVTSECELRSAETSQTTPGRSLKGNKVQVAPFNTTQLYPNDLNKEFLN